MGFTMTVTSDSLQSVSGLQFSVIFDVTVCLNYTTIDRKRVV